MKLENSGFSLLEVLVAISLLGIVTATFTQGTVQMTQMLHEAEIKSKAILAVRQILDETRLTLPSTMPTSSSDTSEHNQLVSVEDTVFDVDVTYCLNPNYCPNISSNETRHVTITATYNNKQYYELQTVYTEFQ